MLKFVKGYLESIEGVSTYPMISLLIFFIFFVVLFPRFEILDDVDVDELADCSTVGL